MNVLKLSHPTKKIIGKISISGSKSESNRLLLLKHLYFPNLELSGLSDSRDTAAMQKALQNKSQKIDAGEAGTVMRFMTAFLAVQENRETEIFGTERMHERPIGILVESLQKLGAEIFYQKKEGFPPLKIIGKKLTDSKISIDGSVSSQFISALMMIGPKVQGGLTLKMRGLSVSTPYIYLTANLMRRLGFVVLVRGDEIRVEPKIPKSPETFAVEPDWSAASYWFLMVLLAEKAEIYLPSFRQYSLQGDSFVSQLFVPLGVESHFIGAGFRLKKGKTTQNEFKINLIHNPDLAQTMAVAFAAKNFKATITGLSTLRIKETDRLAALQSELSKTGAEIDIGNDFLKIKKGIQYLENVRFETYDDHRMAMALAPLSLLAPIEIENPEVVGKSYRGFWRDLERVGTEIR